MPDSGPIFFLQIPVSIPLPRTQGLNSEIGEDEIKVKCTKDDEDPKNRLGNKYEL